MPRDWIYPTTDSRTNEVTTWHIDPASSADLVHVIQSTQLNHEAAREMDWDMARRIAKQADRWMRRTETSFNPSSPLAVEGVWFHSYAFVIAVFPGAIRPSYFILTRDE